jgi:hypothetical protein
VRGEEMRNEYNISVQKLEGRVQLKDVSVIQDVVHQHRDSSPILSPSTAFRNQNT